jgi:hypothetical protein
MNKISMAIYSAIIVLFLINFAFCDEEIRFAFEMFRHGARGPLTVKDGKDIYGEEWMSDGELTEVGMRQHYLIGYRNKQRYKDFLSNYFSTKEMYVISTNYNRTIMSAHSQLQGLFPNGTGPELNDEQQKYALPPLPDDYTEELKNLGKSALPNKSNVFPIHLFDTNARYFGLRDSRICPGVDDLVKENLKKQVLKDYMDRFNSTYGKTFQKILNVSWEFFYDYWSMYSIADTFISDVTDGKELKVLKDEGIDFEEFNKVALEFLKMDILDIGVGDKDNIIPLVSMSPIVLDVLKWMQNRIEKDSKEIGYNGFGSPKFVMYSAHDVEMGAIQLYLKETLNYTDIQYTPFASAIFFELFRPVVEDATKLTENDYTVLINYNGKETRVPFVDFKKGVSEKSYDADKIASFCKFKGDEVSPSKGYIISTFSLGFLTIALIAYIVYSFYKNKKNEDILQSTVNAYNQV